MKSPANINDMPKKKKIQLIAIAFLLIAIPLLIPNTDWSQSTSIYGFLSLIFGTTGSLISIFIPTSYTCTFDTSKWKNDNEGAYQLIIPSKTHGLGKAPHVQTFERNDSSYEEVGVSSKHDNKGNVIIGANSTFDGKVIITA